MPAGTSSAWITECRSRTRGPGWDLIGASQGNLDSARLLAGWDATAVGARAVLAEAAGRPGHIFNLGHGVLPQTDPDLLRRLVELVHEETRRPQAASVMSDEVAVR